MVSYVLCLVAINIENARENIWSFTGRIQVIEAHAKGMQNPHKSTTIAIGLVLLMIFSTTLANLIPQESLDEQGGISEVSARAQTTWSGTVSLSSSYTISVQDEVIVQPCTNITLPSGERIYVDGRLTIQGSETCPVILTSSGLSDHEGIQFNQSSNQRGSIIRNLTIGESIYGITIYSSNPQLDDVTVINPDRVGLDLYSANPIISNLFVNSAGKNLPWQGDWRYGIGLSVGAGSTPIVNGARFTDHLTSAVNIWGSSGGVFRDIEIDNITGSSWAFVSGVWVEDSVPLLQNITIDRADSGIVVRHIDDSVRTRAVIKDMDISNSMYRGVYVDKLNHTNYTNYESADFTNLTVTGTGLSEAKTPGIAYAAIEVNASGAWFENTLVDGADAAGVRLYFVDSTTNFRNITIKDSGDTSGGLHSASIAVRSSYFAPSFHDLHIENSHGPGVRATSGGAIQGVNWHIENSGEQGINIDSASVVIENVTLENNSLSGAKVFDSRYVEFHNLTSLRNGQSGVLPQDLAGLTYIESNDVESNSGDVRCKNCVVHENLGSGIFIEDSVDIWIEDSVIMDNSPDHPEIFADSDGLGSIPGMFHLTDSQVWSNRTNGEGYAIEIVDADGEIDGLVVNGENNGIYWEGRNLVSNSVSSIISDISLSNDNGTACLILKNHRYIVGSGLDLTESCSGLFYVDSSNANFSSSSFSNSVYVSNSSNLRLRTPDLSRVDLNSAIIDSQSKIQLAFDMQIWVLNNRSNGVPDAYVNVTFSDFDTSFTQRTNEIGTLMANDFIAREWTVSGASVWNSVNVSCSYDGVVNYTEFDFDSNKIENCILPLDNQPPYLIWDTPIDEDIYPSQSFVTFDASRSWDLDDDALTFVWESSIDGQLSTQDNFTANDASSSQIPLSDGVHDITLTICDTNSQCVSETRSIELTNLPPIISATLTPSPNPWNELIIPRTADVLVNFSGTMDPESDPMQCYVKASYQSISDISISGCPDLVWFNLSMSESVPSVFQLTLYADDGTNPATTVTYQVELYNEIPNPTFIINRENNFSENVVTFDGSQTFDPEGDAISVEWYSNLDGLLHSGTNQTDLIWMGTLSRGIHTIEMKVTDLRPEHLNSSNSAIQILTVENSAPMSVISTPTGLISFDSSELIPFSANGSGDWDSACDTFPEIGNWWCSPIEPFAGSEYLQINWSSSLDGRLTPEGDDWLIFEERLSAGSHLISLELDDGINSPVVSSVELSIVESAPVINLTTPFDGFSTTSADVIYFDAMESIDYDGDTFTLSLRSNLVTDPLLTDVNPQTISQFSLPAGNHVLTIEATDSTGLTRVEQISVYVVESAPVVSIISPENRYSYPAGDLILLSEDSYDSDGDMVIREWRRWQSDLNFEVISTSSSEEITLSSGEHHLSLYVEDARGNSNEEHLNFTVQSSLPRLLSDTLVINPETLEQGIENSLLVRIELSDPDGSTQDVSATLTLSIQSWEFNLTDEDGDGIWEGSLVVIPNQGGTAFIRITAIDGTGDDAYVDILSDTIQVSGNAGDGTNLSIILAGVGFLVLILAVNTIVSKRRKLKMELEKIESWGAFSSDTKPVEVKKASGAVDSTAEVLAESSNELDEEPKSPNNFDWDNV